MTIPHVDLELNRQLSSFMATKLQVGGMNEQEMYTVHLPQCAGRWVLDHTRRLKDVRVIPYFQNICKGAQISVGLWVGLKIRGASTSEELRCGWRVSTVAMESHRRTPTRVWHP